MNRSALPTLLVILLLTACSGGAPPSSDGGSTDGGAGDGGGSDGDQIAHPTGDDLVLSVSAEGGFMLIEMVVAQVPHFVLLGDGRVIVQGPQTLEFPGPLLPALQVRTLTEEGIQEVLRAVAATELFAEDLELRGAANFVADAPDTVFTAHAGGTDVTVRVYGLGFLAPDMPEDEAGLSPAEAEAHRVLDRLNQDLMLIDQTLPPAAFEDDAWRAYRPEAFLLYVRDAAGEPEDELAGRPREWPGDGDPREVGKAVEGFADGTRCVVVEGGEAEAWLVELEAATQLTRWSDGDGLFAVTPRPVLPFEEAVCP